MPLRGWLAALTGTVSLAGASAKGFVHRPIVWGSEEHHSQIKALTSHAHNAGEVLSESHKPEEGYALFGQARGFCRGRKIHNDKSAGLEDCLSICDTMSDCAYASYWVGSGWCRLTDSCAAVFASVKTINIYEKSAANSSGHSPDGETDDVVAYELFAEESKCSDAPLNSSMAAGVEECGLLCSQNPSCKFFTVYTGGWCKLSGACDSVSEVEEAHCDVYRLVRSDENSTSEPQGQDSSQDSSEAAPDHEPISTEFVGFTVTVSGVSREFGMIDLEKSLEDKIEDCLVALHVTTDMISHQVSGGDPFSDAVTVYVPPRLVKIPATEVIEKLNRCDMRKSVTLAMQKGHEKRKSTLNLWGNRIGVDIGKAAMVAAPTVNSHRWCCLAGFLYDDPCSECMPSLTPTISTAAEPCGQSHGACMSCNRSLSWVDPVWCRI